MLIRGGSIARGQVFAMKGNNEGNLIGRANTHPILNIQECTVEFNDGDISELIANVIAENIYA